jgi:hypothetical protein
MLSIRSQQMDVFRTYMFAQTVAALVERVTRSFPVQAAELRREGRLEGLVRNGVERAEHYGLSQRDNVGRFLEYVLLYGEDFGETPATEWARAILEQPGMHETLKMARLDSHEIFVKRAEHGPRGQ